MDNDLMARRLRPPSQPASGNGQQPQPSSPWDVSLTSEDQFAPPPEQPAPQDPPFAPPDQPAGPDPSLRADVPWDRPEPEPWPPADEGPTDFAPAWSAPDGGAAAHDSRTDWPSADGHPGAATPPWDRPAADEADPSLDPYDALAPVVGDVIQAPADAWASWNGNGHHGIAGAPEPMTVAAHNDGPPDADAPWSSPWDEPPSSAGAPGNPVSASSSGGGSGAAHDPLPDWPAEDDLTVAPSTSRGPVMPEDTWPVTAPVTPPAPTEPAAEADPGAIVPGEAAGPPDDRPVAAEFDSELIDVDAAPEVPEPEPIAAPVDPQPTAPEPATSPVTPSASAVLTPAGATAQNMVLRIEVAIVDESRRANPADAARRVGPDADVRRPEYEPRNHGGRASMPEPEYLWDAPPQAPEDPAQRRRQPAPPAAQSAPARRVSPPPGAWQPAMPTPPEPMTMNWDLPDVRGPQTKADPPAPWSTPTAAPPPSQPPLQAPSPTWALTQPTPPYEPHAPQHEPPAPQHQPPSAYLPPAVPPPAGYPAPPYPMPAQLMPDFQSAPPQPAWPPPQPGPQAHDPLASLPAAPTVPPLMPMQSAQSAPAAGSRARTGQVSADQADLWFLSNQPAAAVVEDEDAQPEGRTSSIATAGLTIGFALLVIVLVLVFIQLMTSLLR